MLRYSDQALSVRPAFYGPYNDVTVIVEDVDKEVFYTEVFNRLFEGNIRLVRVLGLGGKLQVLKRMDERGGESQGRREFYVVDGDFDELIGMPHPNSAFFYRLHRYDIESYLVEETAICAIAQEQSPRLTLDEYRDSLRVGIWVSEVVEASAPLAACAALLQQLDDDRPKFLPVH